MDIKFHSGIELEIDYRVKFCCDTKHNSVQFQIYANSTKYQRHFNANLPVGRERSMANKGHKCKSVVEIIFDEFFTNSIVLVPGATCM